MTVTVVLPVDVEQAYLAEAQAKGVPVDAVIREALVAGKPQRPSNDDGLTGAALVDAMQKSPYKEVCLEPERYPLPVRDVAF